MQVGKAMNQHFEAATEVQLVANNLFAWKYAVDGGVYFTLSP